VGLAEVLPTQERLVPIRELEEMHERSLRDPEGFWSEVAGQLHWFKSWERVLEWKPPFARWFVGGLINASFNALDRHIKTWRRNKVALIWEGEPGDSRTLTYYQLYREVNRFASALKKLGVGKGDVVAIYMPMIPEAVVAMLAAARIGAVHTVIFSGFGPGGLAERINDSEARVLITADGFYRRGRESCLKAIADEALAKCPSVEYVIVVRRTGKRDTPIQAGRDFWWHEVMEGAENYVESTPVESTHPLFILYTSGTTGKPKGVVHSTGGYLVGVYATMKWVFDIRDEDVYWCTADIGWITGHSYIVYGPLLHGAAVVMYEGAPDYPKPDRWWSIVEKYGVTIFYTAPTAIRMLMKYGDGWVARHDLSTLRILGTVGEPLNPEAWMWYYRVVGRERCPIVDTWWQTETGAHMISPAPGISLVPLKPGSVTLPLPGVDAEVVLEDGKPAPPRQRGYLVIRRPWPSMLMTLHRDPERYKQTYWSRFVGWYFTGDYALKDEDGYFWILGRADEVLKISGHRIGTMELESALVKHSAVAEAAVIGRPHPVKGEEAVAFIVLRDGFTPSEKLRKDIEDYIRKTIGSIAVPGLILFVSKLPKTRSGKIMRRVIKAIVTESEIGDLSTLEDEASVDEVKKAVEEFKRIAEEAMEK